MPDLDSPYFHNQYSIYCSKNVFSSFRSLWSFSPSDNEKFHVRVFGKKTKFIRTLPPAQKKGQKSKKKRSKKSRKKLKKVQSNFGELRYLYLKKDKVLITAVEFTSISFEKTCVFSGGYGSHLFLRGYRIINVDVFFRLCALK